jgi:rhodanese-related sulfurtransferase
VLRAPFGSAKDPINFAGMVAAGVLRGDVPVSHWDSQEAEFLLGVREPAELAVVHVSDAINIPLGELLGRLDELPDGRDIRVICRSGQRAYYAGRILLQEGFDASVVSGGMLSHAILPPPVRQEAPA